MTQFVTGATDAGPSRFAVIPGAEEEFEREVKFVLAAVHVPLVLGWLWATCRSDGLHAVNRVCSIYYDTPGLDLLREKLNSDFLKLKVRARWYEPIEGAASVGEGGPAHDGPTHDSPASDGPAYVEAKSRVGALRRKVRVRTPQGARALAALSLSDPLLPRLPDPLRMAGIVLPPALAPACRIEYVRHRFVEPSTQARVSLDWGIEAPATSPRLIPATPGGRLNVGVLEVKGAGEDLPDVLKGLSVRWIRRSSFSKYSACFEKLRRARN